MTINKSRKFCYRITHRDNLANLLEFGLLNKNHAAANGEFVSIGNLEIIDVRSTTSVSFPGFGVIGDYVPFYFTPRSIMLFNILTGYYHPKVLRRSKDEIVVIRCIIEDLTNLPKWFFTDGQANDGETHHYIDLAHLGNIDWECIQMGNFSKTDGDYDRSRRYQAEFLVDNYVPVEYIESICVYNEDMELWAINKINNAGLAIPVHVHKPYFFD